MAANEIHGSFAFGAVCAIAGESTVAPPLPASTLRGTVNAGPFGV